MARSLALCIAALAANAAAESCFGTSSKYDAQCATLKSEAECANQFVCRWANPETAQCYPQDPSDQHLKKQCAVLDSESKCDAQFGCVWRSSSDVSQWITSLSSAVDSLVVPPPSSIPLSVSLGSPTLSSEHDHQSLNVGDLSSVLNAWKAKYELPDEVVTSLQALVSIESAEFKATSRVIQPTAGQVKVVAAGGRNYNGQVLIAFVFGTSTVSVTKLTVNNTCVGSSCSGPNLEDARPGYCMLDGQPLHIQCCTACSTGRCAAYNRTDPCKGMASPNRPLTTAENTAILQFLQNGISSKIQAEAALLENELRKGTLHFLDKTNVSLPLNMMVV